MYNIPSLISGELLFSEWKIPHVWNHYREHAVFFGDPLSEYTIYVYMEFNGGK